MAGTAKRRAIIHIEGVPEYAMVMAAHEKGWLDGPAVMRESVLAIRRAGADVIITYFAKRLAEEWANGSKL